MFEEGEKNKDKRATAIDKSKRTKAKFSKTKVQRKWAKTKRQKHKDKDKVTKTKGQRQKDLGTRCRTTKQEVRGKRGPSFTVMKHFLEPDSESDSDRHWAALKSSKSKSIEAMFNCIRIGPPKTILLFTTISLGN